jgi:hypothetical protein
LPGLPLAVWRGIGDRDIVIASSLVYYRDMEPKERLEFPDLIPEFDRLAKAYVWWNTPDETRANIPFLLASIMERGDLGRYYFAAEFS